NDIENYQADSPENMAVFAYENNFHFPYLYDETQEKAKVYQAACTPDFYLCNASNRLVDHGQLDDSGPGNIIPVSSSDLRNAIDSILYNRTINPNQKPSIGCNIKWKNN